MTTPTLACSRCGLVEAPALPRAPLPGPMGKEIQQRVCADCWAAWQNMEVMVINELRLNFMDPKAQETLEKQMRRFFLWESGDTPEALEGLTESGRSAD
jgi:Fe-S cluster biosynthesis and repair protein YggX